MNYLPAWASQIVVPVFAALCGGGGVLALWEGFLKPRVRAACSRGRPPRRGYVQPLLPRPICTPSQQTIQERTGCVPNFSLGLCRSCRSV